MIAIIPARGGSKGLPGKNIKMLCGKPMIAYAIDAAKKSKYIDHVVVSTDDQQIADIALQYGAEIPFLRPDFLAFDTAQAVDNYIYTTISRHNVAIRLLSIVLAFFYHATTEYIYSTIRIVRGFQVLTVGNGCIENIDKLIVFINVLMPTNRVCFWSVADN